MDSMTLGLLIIGSIGAIGFIEFIVWIVLVTRRGSGDFLRFDLRRMPEEDLRSSVRKSSSVKVCKIGSRN